MAHYQTHGIYPLRKYIVTYYLPTYMYVSYMSNGNHGFEELVSPRTSHVHGLSTCR